MKQVEYHPDGIAFSDAAAEQKAREFLKSDRNSIRVSTENFIMALRCFVREKNVSHEDLIFLFNSKTIRINEYGRLSDWPNGFCDYNDRYLDRLLSTRK